MNDIAKSWMIIVVVLVFSCQSKTQKTDAINQEKKAAKPKEHSGKEHPGKAVYTKYCLTCHQADGSGVPNMHPPLTPGSWVGKEPEVLISILMKGLSGKVEVDGETYKNFMPSQAQLNDEQMADVLSYIRSNFGNDLTPVTEEMVRKVRSGN